ncbi:MAG TPA: hypothetical protein VHM28_01285 [Anaerolineales bacterium]|jgi:hypothetical protein|nr:hypothetical protein [Anaerolineales bacterium]
MNSIRRVSFPAWTIPIVLLLIVFVAYGLFAAQGGIHWDDWAFMWIPAFLGKEGLVKYFSTSRPLWGYFFVLTTSLIGTNIFGWQIFALIWRWLAGVALWWALRLAWPNKSSAAFFITLFTMLYPGFIEHSIVITYGHFSLVLTLFFLSIALMLLCERYPRYRWPAMFGGVLCSAVSLFSLEYYFGIELLRPLLLWMVISNIVPDKKQQIRRALLAYLPYALVLAAFILWRLYGFHSHDYQVQAFQGLSPNGGQSLGTSFRQLPEAIWASSFGAWGQIFQFPPTADMGPSLSIIYLVLILGSFAGLLFYVSRFEPPDNQGEPSPPEKAIAWQWLILGGCALLTAGIPFYIVGLQVRLAFPADRLTQPFALGVALVLAGLLELIPSISWRTMTSAALVSLAIGLQIQYGFSFRQDWKLQKSYFWQLYWRVPALQPGTAVLSESSIFPYTDDDALTLPLNWIYAPNQKNGSLPYAQTFFIVNADKSIPLTADTPLDMKWDAVSFHGSTDAALVLQFAPPSCLHILNPSYDSDLPVAPLSGENYEALSNAGFPLLGRDVAKALPLSNPMLIEIPIDSAPPTPSALSNLFGAEPAHGWCFYYEKADLARQTGDWTQVANLGDRAFASSYRPDDLSEYLPFIEAYARLKRWDDAKQLTLSTADAMPILEPALCGLWQRVNDELLLSDQERGFMLKVEDRLQYCPIH